MNDHFVEGSMTSGEAIGLSFDQALCQDATGTLVMLTLEAMGIERVRTCLSAQYVDHNLIQQDNRNSDDHVADAEETRDEGGHVIVAGDNYGQGSSREHAALAPRSGAATGARQAVFADSLAGSHQLRRIAADFRRYRGLRGARRGNSVTMESLYDQLDKGGQLTLDTGERSIEVRHSLSKRRLEVFRADGTIDWIKENRA